MLEKQSPLILFLNSKKNAFLYFKCLLNLGCLYLQMVESCEMARWVKNLLMISLRF